MWLPRCSTSGSSKALTTPLTRINVSLRSKRAASNMPSAAASAASDPPPVAYVYSGPGAGTRSVLSTLHSLREALLPAVKVASLDTADLLAGGWQDGCLLLVMPGGADLPYCKHLNGQGNQLIRAYVEGGGAYLGLCAGAYYACARVEFEPGTRLEVVGERELAFFPGASVGSVYKGFQYESEGGAVAAPLRYRRPHAEPRSAAAKPDGAAAEDGAGGAGLEPLSGWQQCVDYVNGGPAFTQLDGSPLPPVLVATLAAPPADQPPQGQQQGQEQDRQGPAVGQQQQQQLCGVELLATYPEQGHAAAALMCRVGSAGGRAVLCGTHPELHPSWLTGQPPPSNGSGQNGSSSSSSGAGSGGSPWNGPQPRQTQPAAAAATRGNAAAEAGQQGGYAQQAQQACGVAGSFVDTVENRAAAASSLAAELGAESQVLRLQAALAAGQQQRVAFWRSLLEAAGLQPWLLLATHAEDE